MDRAALDAAYNNTLAVTSSARLLAGFEARSKLVRAAHPKTIDLRYGPAERSQIDYFPGASPGPLLAFIHGGYWQSRAKETFAFLAPGVLAQGVHFASIGYTLAPEKPLRAIIAEVSDALTWLVRHASDYGGDPGRIYTSGWSAGGHLATSLLDHPGVRGGLAISGIYDLEPIRGCYLNVKLQLTESEARSLSPRVNPRRSRTPLVVAYGGGELPELRRQSETFAAESIAAGLPVKLLRLPGHNHFSILEELAAPDGTLASAVHELVL
jgi:arylformamidase